MSKITVTTIAGLTSGGDANTVKIESGDTLAVQTNATVGGTLGVTGATTLTGATTIGGDLTVDTSTLKVDSSNNRIGIGTTSPISVLNIEATKTTALSSEAHFTTLGLCIDDNTAYNTALAGGGIAFRHKKNPAGDMNVYGAIDGVRIDNANGRVGGHLRFFTNNDSDGIPKERVRINSSGNFGINTTSPVTKLHVNSGGNDLMTLERSTKSSGSGFAGFNIETNSQLTLAFDDGADFVIGDSSNPSTQAGFTERFKIKSSNGLPYSPASYSVTTGTGANMYIQSDGAFYRSTSSRRYKNTINDSTHGLSELLKLRSVTYKGNNDGDNIFGGLIAEEVHDAGLTEFVQYNDDNEPDALSYGNMVSLCIKAIQELSVKNDALETKVKALESK